MHFAKTKNTMTTKKGFSNESGFRGIGVLLCVS